jgi:HK97 family phage major capsid protein
VTRAEFSPASRQTCSETEHHIVIRGGSKVDNNISKLREEFSSLHTAATAVIEKAVNESREVTAEEQAENAKRFDRMDKIKSVMDQSKRLAEYAFNKSEVKLPAEPEGKAVYEAEIKVSDRFKFDAKNTEHREMFGKAMTRWAATGEMENRFATITTATQSGLFLPVGVLTPFVGTATNAFREGYTAWGQQPVQTPGDTSEFTLPVVDATAGGQVAENASSETDGTPTLTDSIVSQCKTYQSGSVYYSNLQLSATKFDLLQSTVPALTYGKELGLESTIAAAIIADAGITQTTATATVTGFTFGNFTTLDNSLPKRYQVQKVLVLSQAAYAAAEGLTDTVGRPIMTPDAQNQSLRRILGTPVVRSDYFSAFGANNIVGAIFSLPGFHLRDAGEGIIRYNQLPAKPNQTGINLFGYHAYGYAKKAVALLKCPVS